MTMRLSKPQARIANDLTRNRVAICGRRFGKTVLAIRELCKASVEPRTLSWYVAPSYKQARQVVFQQLKETLIDLRWLRKTNETNLEFYLKNGSTIALKGADNYDSLRGVGIGGILVMDEFADIKPEAWDVLRPTLSDKGGRALFIGTPKGIGNWSYDMFNMALSDPESWSAYQYTTLQGGRVPEEEIEAARRDLAEKTFNQEYNGTFETYSGVIYYNFSRDRNVQRYEGNTPSVLHIGLDFNIDPMSAVVGAETPEGFHIIDELEIYGSNTKEIIQEVSNRYPGVKVFVYPDASGSQRSTNGGHSNHIILQNAGWVLKAPHRNPPVKDRIASVNGALLSGTGEIKLRIDPKCKTTIKSLERQVYKEGTQIPEKTGYDHMNDALGYVINSKYPIRRDRPVGDPGSWKHRIGAT
jgi:hypothetical protein